MSLSPEAKILHQEYENSHPGIQWAVDRAFEKVEETFTAFGYDTSKGDPAEELVAAIYKYLIDSAEPTTPEAA